MRKVIKILGKPGTGKTTFLANKILEKTSNGYGFDDILFVTYSRSASRAMFQKLYEKGIERKHLTNFGTIYKLTNKTLNLSDDNYIEIKDFERFAGEQGLLFDPSMFSVKQLDEVDEFGLCGDTSVYVEGNVLFPWWQFLKCVFVTDSRVKRAIRCFYGLGYNQQRVFMHRSIDHIVRLYELWEEYKESENKFEYQDMLQNVLEYDVGYVNPFRFAFVDEAHDFGLLQMSVLDMWCSDDYVLEEYICYDPLQTIYRFTGSNPRIVENIRGDENIVLEKSHRVPEMPWNLAIKLARFINDDSMKGIKACDKRGSVRFVDDLRSFLKTNRLDVSVSSFFLLRRNEDVRLFLDFMERFRLPVRGIGRTRTVWDIKYFRDIYNLLICLDKEKPPEREEVRSLLLRLPASLLKHGLKQDYKTRKYKHWGDDEGVKLFDDKLSLFYSVFRGDVGSVHDVKDILMQPRVKLSNRQKMYLRDTSRDDLLVRDLRWFAGTFHASKGLEADNVFLFDYPLRDGWNVADETRLCYVGVTRTLDSCFIIGNERGGFIEQFI